MLQFLNLIKNQSPILTYKINSAAFAKNTPWKHLQKLGVLNDLLNFQICQSCEAKQFQQISQTPSPFLWLGRTALSIPPNHDLELLLHAEHTHPPSAPSLSEHLALHILAPHLPQVTTLLTSRMPSIDLKWHPQTPHCQGLFEGESRILKQNSAFSFLVVLDGSVRCVWTSGLPGFRRRRNGVEVVGFVQDN